MVQIKDRTFIISGGASGLGNGAAVQILKAGGFVAIVDRDVEVGMRVVQELDASKCRFYPTDVGKSEDIAGSLEMIYGWIKSTGAGLGGVVCAAGIGEYTPSISEDGVSCDMTAFDRTMRVNVRGSVDLACQTLPYWTKQEVQAGPENPDAERGVIIFISSILAFEGQAGSTAYSASKAAIAGLTLPMTRDLVPHAIRVVSIAPGLFDTPLVAKLPKRQYESNMAGLAFPPRPGQPADFGALVRHIFENVYLNGLWLRFDGGRHFIPE